MSGRIVALLDVTMMQGDAVCIAGIDVDSGQTVRLNNPQPTRSMLRGFGGLAPGDRINVDWRNTLSEKPHVEDRRWEPTSLRKLDQLSFDELVAAASRQRFDSIHQAFGEPALRGRNHNHAWKRGNGERSLATVRARYVRFALEERGDARRVRVALRDQANGYWEGIPFQDLIARRHEMECHACDDGLLQNIKHDFEANACVVRVGLTRPAKLEDYEELCWLQVTNILARPRVHFV